MIYKKFQDLELSALGMGCMRLPVIGGDNARPDEAAVAELLAYAMEHGINYYDTAWPYHGGNSEVVLGKALANYPRESFYLADKFPGFDLTAMGRVEEIFEAQLKKCGVDYFDFYLFHNVCESNVDAYLDPQYGVLDYLLRQKEAGRIRHLGFSTHGALPTMERFLDACGDRMEFCQIQLNYVDWSFQDAKGKVALLERYGLPVWVMEPVRGGRLARLSGERAAPLKALRPEESVPAWAFRFLQSIPGVTVTLSGMSNMEQLKDNIATFQVEKPLDEAEMEALLEVAEKITGAILPCTSCRYCVDHCPQGLDIPRLLSLYNEHAFTGGGSIDPAALKAVPEEKWPTACLGCRSCEAVCPQQLKIAGAMADFAAKLHI